MSLYLSIQTRADKYLPPCYQAPNPPKIDPPLANTIFLIYRVASQKLFFFGFIKKKFC